MKSPNIDCHLICFKKDSRKSLCPFYLFSRDESLDLLINPLGSDLYHSQPNKLGIFEGEEYQTDQGVHKWLVFHPFGFFLYHGRVQKSIRVQDLDFRIFF